MEPVALGLPSSPENGVVSLAARIAHARERAESFTSRHGQSRESRKEPALPVDKERLRWTQIYHEKSVAIEQLERELGITVEALHKSQRSQIGVEGEVSKDSADSKPTHLDLLNLTDALRKENSSLKDNLDSVQGRKAVLEEDLALLKRENLNLKREIEILQRQLTSSSDRWLKQEAEYNASISSLESELIDLRAESILHRDADKSAEKRHSKDEVELNNVGSAAADHELHTARLLLSTAREEVLWLREILEYDIFDTFLTECLRRSQEEAGCGLAAVQGRDAASHRAAAEIAASLDRRWSILEIRANRG